MSRQARALRRSPADVARHMSEEEPTYEELEEQLARVRSGVKIVADLNTEKREKLQKIEAELANESLGPDDIVHNIRIIMKEGRK